MARQKELALDTNVIFDLAAGVEVAFDFKELFQFNDYALKVGPTVSEELSFKSQTGSTREQELASIALASIAGWEIYPYSLQPVQRAIAEQVSERLMRSRYLPEDERNDGLILAESALAEIPLLVTSDSHLLEIPQKELAMLLSNDFHLTVVTPVHPGGLVKAIEPI